jgi:hypothetical protein
MILTREIVLEFLFGQELHQVNYILNHLFIYAYDTWHELLLQITYSLYM